MRKLKYLSAVLLSAIALTACEDDLAVINPDPGQPSTVPDGTTTSKVILSSETVPQSEIVLLDIGDPDADALIDKARLILPQAFDHDVTFRVGMNENFDKDSETTSRMLLEFNKAHNFEANFFIQIPGIGFIDPKEVVKVNGEKAAYIHLKAGETASDQIEISFDNNYLRHKSDYPLLLPIEVSDAGTGEIYYTAMYLINPLGVPTIESGTKAAVLIGYVDTEVMQPLIYNVLDMSIDFMDFNTGEERNIYKGSMFDIINLCTAFIKEENGLAKLNLTPDLEYVLRNRVRYVKPLQNNDKKVCLCIKAGGTGLGFSNMTDDQIADFTNQIKVILDMYDLDGVNLYDVGANYNMDNATPINAESYAKLIKAVKTAMPDKLLTMVDTRETTDALCDPVAGISVGDYLDYAWSSLNDFLAPYEPGASIRPLASLPENRYATLFVHDPFDMEEEDNYMLNPPEILQPYLEGMRYDPLSATDVFVYDNIPLKTTANEGIYSSLLEAWCAVKYPMDADFSAFTYATIILKYGWHYNMFKKDW